MNKSDLILDFKKFKNSKGFTLIEILIAVTLLSFVSIGVISITDNAILTKERTTLVNKNNLEVETALSRFEWDFSQVYSPLYFSEMMKLGNSNAQQGGGFIQENDELQQYFQQLSMRFEGNDHFIGISQDGLPIPRFSQTGKSTLEFFTSSNRRKRENQKQSYYAWVRYALERPDPEEERNRSDQEINENLPSGLFNLVRYFTPFNPYSEEKIQTEGVEKIKGSVLLTHIESLEFQFWDYEKRKWQNSLRSIPQGENMIKGVKIILTWYDSFGIKKVISRTFRPLWPIQKFKNSQSGIIYENGSENE